MSQTDDTTFKFSNTLGKAVFELQTDPDDFRPVFLSGNFNNWKGADPTYAMELVSPGKYKFQFPSDFKLTFPLEYKYMRGGWEGEELDEFGSKTNNRVIEKPQNIIQDEVSRWAIRGKGYQEQYLPKIHVLSEKFEIPQLIKTRRITALLPHNYFDTQKRYPVLYLQDGQNLFDENAPFGNWGVHKKLAVMAEKGMGEVIIVAIDHAKEERIAEFTPSTINPRKGAAEGKKYVRFLADTLKPFIDKHFRTLPDVRHTGIGGSSMGGLISIYAGLMYPEVYSKLLIFSPALWMAPNLHFNAIHLHEGFNTRIYIYAGGKESTTMIPNVERFKKMVNQKKQKGSKLKFEISIDPEGAHTERQWGTEFPKAMKWLFFNAQ